MYASGICLWFLLSWMYAVFFHTPVTQSKIQYISYKQMFVSDYGKNRVWPRIFSCSLKPWLRHTRFIWWIKHVLVVHFWDSSGDETQPWRADVWMWGAVTRSRSSQNRWGSDSWTNNFRWKSWKSQAIHLLLTIPLFITKLKSNEKERSGGGKRATGANMT